MSSLPPSIDPSTPGTILARKYRVESVIGQGGMGIVLAAWHIALDQRVAIKLLLADAVRQPQLGARFLREARAAAKIRSEHVARVIDTGTLDDGAPYMVMEYLAGSDLAGVLRDRGVLAIEDAVDYVIQGCEAIAEAHLHGIVHRDLKPANLFLSERPNGSRCVKVLDFGISKMADAGAENLTGTIEAMGTALYMSPEQMRQTKSVDLRTDIYALGISLHELLAGQPPFYAATVPLLCVEVLTGQPTPLRDARPDVPEGLAAVIAKAHAREREQRFSSVGELVQALAPYAPARSRPAIDSVIQMAGIPGAAGSSPAASVVTPPFAVGATEPLPREPQRPPATALQAPLLPTGTAPPVVSAAPAAAPVAAVSGVTGGPPARSRVGLLVGAVSVIGLLAGAAFFALRAPVTDPGPPASPGAPSREKAAPTTPPAVPEPSASPPATATASATATAAPSATTTAATSAARPAVKPSVPPGPRITNGPARPPTDVGF